MTCNISYIELSEYQAGNGSERVRQHLAECPACRHRLEALTRTDAALRSIPRVSPSDEAALRVRQNLAQEIRGADRPEIMTLTDVADFLRLSPAQLDEIIGELPAFELGGQIRVRRTRLLEWIEHREREFQQSTLESEIARSTSRFSVRGVA